MVTYRSLEEKFSDKGMLDAFYWLVIPPAPFDSSRLMGPEIEKLIIYKKCIQQVYGPEWDYWNTWIDYQQYKF